MTPISISEARTLGESHGIDRLVIFAVNNDGKVAFTSYGKDRATCQALKRWLMKMTRNVRPQMWQSAFSTPNREGRMADEMTKFFGLDTPEGQRALAIEAAKSTVADSAVFSDDQISALHHMLDAIHTALDMPE